MKHSKQYLLLSLLVTVVLALSSCSGGEADYTLEEVLNQNLVTGSAEFDIPNHYVIEENTSVVTTIKIITTGKYSFTIAGGEDKSLFKIDPNSGQLSFSDAPRYDFGGDNSYEVVVGVVVDSELSTFTIGIDVVQDITLIDPIIDYVAERLDAVITTDLITQIKVRPADESSYVVFTLDPDSNRTFQIDREGHITLREPLPDFATIPSTDFNLSVTVTDGYGNSVVVGPVEITLVENRDLIRPVVETKSIYVIENSLGSTEIKTTVLGTGVVDRYLLGGKDATYFTLSDTGILSFKVANDYETPPNLFEVTVQIGDDKGNLSDVQTVMVTVSDLDEHFTFHGVNDFSPMEGTTAVGTLSATPNVLSLPPIYSLLQGEERLDIDQNGTLTFKTAALKGEVVAVEVLAESGLNGSETLSGTFYVRVQDDPTKIAPLFESYARTLTLSTAVDEALSIMTVAAVPQGTATSLYYEVVGTDRMMFTITADGKLYFTNGTGNYARQDANSDNIYEIAVTATDNYGNTVTSDTIKITLIIDETITFEPVADTSVSEGSVITNTLVAVSAAGYDISYSVQSGYDPEIEVTVDAITGYMTVLGVNYISYFFSNPNYHTFTVRAQDPYGNVVSQDITIQVTR